MRQWTNDLTFKLLEKIQARKSLLLDPKLRRRMVYSEVAEEFQVSALEGFFSHEDFFSMYCGSQVKLVYILQFLENHLKKRMFSSYYM